jgi:hypothetical protein
VQRAAQVVVSGLPGEVSQEIKCVLCTLKVIITSMNIPIGVLVFFKGRYVRKEVFEKRKCRKTPKTK